MKAKVRVLHCNVRELEERLNALEMTHAIVLSDFYDHRDERWCVLLAVPFPTESEIARPALSLLRKP